MVTEAWLPAELADTLTESALLQAPLYRLAGGRRRLSWNACGTRSPPRSPVRATRNLLDTAIGAALIRVNRLAFVAGAPHHYLSILLSPNRSRVLLSQTSAELNDPGRLGGLGGIDGLAFAHDVRRESR